MVRRDKRARATGRLGVQRGERYCLLPVEVLESEAWSSLPGNVAKVCIALAAQYSGINNGRLSLPLSVAKTLGVRSKSILNGALHVLEERGLIEITRQGGLPPLGCSWYALGWRAIDADDSRGMVAKPAPNRWAQWKQSGPTTRRTLPARPSVHDASSSPAAGPAWSDSRTS